MRKEWTEEEVAFLEKYYERRGVDYIAKRLNRTLHSVKRKAQKLGYNSYVVPDLYVRTVAACFNCDSRVINRWIDKFDLPAFTVKRGQLTCKLINAKKFWKWAEHHKKLIPWEKYTRSSILPEPKWLPETLKEYSVQNNRKRITDWDIRTVIRMKHQGYRDKDIAEVLNRTLDSVKHIWKQVKEDETWNKPLEKSSND